MTEAHKQQNAAAAGTYPTAAAFNISSAYYIGYFLPVSSSAFICAVTASSAAKKACFWVMAFSVRFRQSSISSPKYGKPTLPAAANLCSPESSTQKTLSEPSSVAMFTYFLSSMYPLVPRMMVLPSPHVRRPSGVNQSTRKYWVAPEPPMMVASPKSSSPGYCGWA